MNIPDVSNLLAQCFEWLLRSSWQGAILIAAVLLAQKLLRRQLNARWRFNLWLLVLVRFVVPFSPESALSVFNYVKPHPVVFSVPAVQAVTAVSPTAAPASASSGAAVKTESKINPPAAESSAAQRDTGATPLAISRPAPSVSAPQIRNFSAVEIASLIWLVGIAGLSTQVARLMIRTRRQVRRATPVQDEAILGLFEECRSQMGVRASLRLLETDIVKSPALCGVLRPALLLPPGLTRNFSLQELRYVFLHELAHVKRRDVALNWLLTALQILHWFNPVVWFGFARMRADRELACDALAISSAHEEEAKDYGRTIIKLLETLSCPSALPGLVGIMEDKTQMQRRIRMIAAFKKTRQWSILALVVMGALAVTGLTDAVKSRETKNPNAKASDSTETFPVTILDGQTGKPLADASVICWSRRLNHVYEGTPPMVRTDGNGIVLATWDSKDAFPNIHVVHPEYAPAAVQWPWPNFDPSKKPQKPKQYSVKLDPGVEIGGIVRDEDGKPVPNVRVEIEGMAKSWRNSNEDLSPLEYPFFDSLWGNSPITDANGKWTCAHFPSDIGLIKFCLVRPDNSCVRFHTELPEWFRDAPGDQVQLSAALAGDAVFVMKKGITVRGVVLDPAGKPLANIAMTETDGRAHAKPVYEFKTDRNGRFELPNRDPHQILLSAKVPGLALKPQVVEVAPGMSDLRIQMGPAKPLRVRVLDEAEQPIAKATVALNGFIFRLKPTWSGTTGADGRAVWEEAPGESLKYRITAEGYEPRTVDMVPDKAEQAVKLAKARGLFSLISVKAETENKKPLDSFTVSIVFRGQTTSENIGEGKSGVFHVKIPDEKVQHGGFQVKIEAPGYEPCTILPERDDSGGWKQVEAVVRKASPVKGVILTPEGKPAAGATLIFSTSTDRKPYIHLRFSPDPKAESAYGDQHNVRTDADGHYSVTSHSGDNPVVIIHDQGFAETTLAELARSPEVRIQPWGHFEGVVTVNSKPKQGAHISFQSSGRKSYDLSLICDREAETDKEGRFDFKKFPPGQYTIQYSTRGKKLYPQNHTTTVQVKSGEVTHLAYEITGRTLTGRIQTPPWFEVNWAHDPISQMLTLKQPKIARSKPPEFSDYVQSDDFMKAQDRWLAFVRDSRNYPETYQLDLNPDGSFQVDGISPGTYELDLRLGKDARRPNEKELITASLECELVVPPAPDGHAAEPFDVGIIKMDVQRDAASKKTQVGLSARMLDGKLLNLMDYRGKCVLLIFWAPWATFSTEDIEALKAVTDAFGTDSRFAMIGVAIEDKADVIDTSMQSNGLKWTNARLEGGDKATATEAWGVNTVPTMFLIGPEGWIVSRDIKGSRLRSAIEDLLKTTK